MATTKNQMNELAIAGKIKAGKAFDVPGNRERKMALTAAKFFGAKIATRKNNAGGFTVNFFAI